MNQEAIHLDPELDQHIKDLIEELKVIMSNDKVKSAYEEAIKNLTPTVYYEHEVVENPWTGASIEYFINYFKKWFTF